ncbi:unnamed protein product [Calypogeia fissa]
MADLAAMDLKVGEQNGPAAGAGVLMVALLTLFMAVVTGLGAFPFFFMKLEAQVAGICNGIASGVMLAASFDLIQEGQKHGGGSWVVIGILIGGFFIYYCKSVLERYEDVKMMELKGADARKMMLVVGIMFLHSLGEGAGVGVSYAGPQGVPQGLVVTLAIAVHNIPEGMAVCMVLTSRGVKAHHAMLWSIFTSLPQPLVAVPAFICAQTFQKFLPLCMGFAAGCMIWMVLAEVLPDSFKEASHSQVASAATLSVACMEILSASVQNLDSSSSWELSPAANLSILFGLGNTVGGLLLLGLLKTIRLPTLLLTGIGCGIAFVLASWPPLQFLLTGDRGLFSLAALLLVGILAYIVISRYFLDSTMTEAKERRKLQTGLISIRSPLRRASLVATACMVLYIAIEGLLLSLALANASGPIVHTGRAFFFHSFSGGMVIACTVYGGTGSFGSTLVATSLSGVMGFLAAFGATLLPLTSQNVIRGWMVAVCGCVFAVFGLSLARQALGVDSKKIIVGAVIGYIIAIACLVTSKLISFAL